MHCPSIVRIAREEDRQETWRLFLMGHQENGMFELDPSKVDWFMSRALHPELIPPWDTGPRGAIGVIGPVGALEALVFVTIGGFWYSSRKHLEEFIVFVDPAHRKGNSDHVRALVQWMKDQSDASGLPLVTGVISNHRTAAKCRLYGQMLPKVGEFFAYGLKGGAHSSSAAFA